MSHRKSFFMVLKHLMRKKLKFHQNDIVHTQQARHVCVVRKKVCVYGNIKENLLFYHCFTQLNKVSEVLSHANDANMVSCIFDTICVDFPCFLTIFLDFFLLEGRKNLFSFIEFSRTDWMFAVEIFLYNVKWSTIGMVTLQILLVRL